MRFGGNGCRDIDIPAILKKIERGMLNKVPFRIGKRELIANIWHEHPEPEVGFRGLTIIEEIEGVSPKAEKKIIEKFGDAIIFKTCLVRY